MTFRLDHTLAALAVALLATALPVEARDMDTSVRKIVILHTNDLHGHPVAWKGWEGELKGKTVGGLDRLAGAVAQVRKEHGEAVLLLDAGDPIGDTMIAHLTEGRAMIEALNHLGYDALAVGNHEPDFDMQKLRQRSKEAKLPPLAANLVGEDGRLFTTPYVVKKVNRVAVGVLGLAYPKTERTTAKKNVAQVTFQDPVPTVKRSCREGHGRTCQTGRDDSAGLVLLSLAAAKSVCRVGGGTNDGLSFYSRGATEFDRRGHSPVPSRPPGARFATRSAHVLAGTGTHPITHGTGDAPWHTGNTSRVSRPASAAHRSASTARMPACPRRT